MFTFAARASLPATVPSRPGGYRRAVTAGSEAIYDAGLVRRFIMGDETAFTIIMTRYRGLLFSVAFGVLKNRGDDEEIAQDAFLSAHRGLGGFRGASSLATCRHRIALNLFRDRYWYFHRHCRQASVSLDAALGEQSRMTFSDLVTTDEMGPSRHGLIGEFSDLVAQCMPRLCPPRREVLARTQRHSNAEIARHSGISISTVKSRIARARARLRVLMSETCPEFNAAERRVEWFDPVRPAGGIEVMPARAGSGARRPRLRADRVSGEVQRCLSTTSNLEQF